MMFQITDTEVRVSCSELQRRLIGAVENNLYVGNGYLCSFLDDELLHEGLLLPNAGVGVIEAFRAAFGSHITDGITGVDYSFNDASMTAFLNLGHRIVGNDTEAASYGDCVNGYDEGEFRASHIRAFSRIGMLARMIEAGVTEIVIER